MKRIKWFLLLTFLFLCMMSLLAQVQDWSWAYQAGGYNYDIGHGIAFDSNDNIYVTGYFYDTAYFGGISLTSSGQADIFIAKLTSYGSWLWVRQAGGTEYDTGYAIALDSSDNVIITGFFEGTASFGTTDLVSIGNSDIFVAQLDSDGNWLWATRAGSPFWDFGYSIVVDDNSNVYITGEFSQIADFGSTQLGSIGSYDIFVAKLDSNGNWLWASRAGSPDWDWGWAIGLDSNTNVHVSGAFRSIADFGSTNLFSTGSQDIFVAQLDSNNGNWQWARRAGSFGDDIGYAIVIDNNDYICVSGFFSDTADFGSTNLVSSGMEDIFVAKLDNTGNWQWAQRAGGPSLDKAYGIAIDSNNNIYITGQFEGQSDFGTTTLYCNGPYDIFVAKLNNSGNWLWAKNAGGSNWDWGSSIAVDNNDDVALTGYIMENAYFGDFLVTSGGQLDIFVAKISHEESQPVQLSSFTANVTAGIFVELQWTTETETNLLGYNILRSSENDLSVANKINPSIIPSAGNSSTPQEYSYLDEDVEMQSLYYYWLEVIEMDMITSFYGPISVLVEENPDTPPVIERCTRLIGPYPNPFNPGTNIRYELAEPANVSVTIYNTKGQFVNKLTQDSKIGYSSIFWNGKDDKGKDCLSGIYFYHFLTNTEYREYGKMILLK